MIDCENILKELGYPYKDMGTYFNFPALYRGGDDINSVVFYKDSGLIVDFVSGKTFNLTTLVQLTLGHQDITQAKDWLKNKDFRETEKKEIIPKIKLSKVLDANLLNNLKQNHTYWINRGISPNVIEQFKGGVCDFGRFKDYYVFPIFNSKMQIIGLSGRNLRNDERPKWKLGQNKGDWRFPLFLSYKPIKEKKTIYLMESIGDVLAARMADVDNLMCLFGISISTPQINTLLSLNLKKIYVSLNNDSQNNNVGNLAAKKLKDKLDRYFDSNVVQIKLPKKEKDWNDVLLKEGKEKLKEQLL